MDIRWMKVMTMILMIDNYDSFVYNLVQYLEGLNETVQVVRNDALTISDIRNNPPKMIVLSPGPCSPTEAGICLEVVKELAGEIPILGICLGHQTIGQAFGAQIIRSRVPVHGKVFPIHHENSGVFRGLKNPLNVTRYHSLTVDESSLPSCLKVTARTDEGEIMGIKHVNQLVEGVQFHPEAILTECGMELLDGFLQQANTFWLERRKPCITESLI